MRDVCNYRPLPRYLGKANEKQTKELQDAINKMVFNRVDATQQLEKCRVYEAWLSHFGAIHPFSVPPVWILMERSADFIDDPKFRSKGFEGKLMATSESKWSPPLVLLSSKLVILRIIQVLESILPVTLANDNNTEVEREGCPCQGQTKTQRFQTTIQMLKIDPR